MLTIKNLRENSPEELQTKHDDLCREIFKLVSELKISRKLEHPHELKTKKKDRARVLTVLRQKQIEKTG